MCRLQRTDSGISAGRSAAFGLPSWLAPPRLEVTSPLTSGWMYRGAHVAGSSMRRMTGRGEDSGSTALRASPCQDQMVDCLPGGPVFLAWRGLVVERAVGTPPESLRALSAGQFSGPAWLGPPSAPLWWLLLSQRRGMGLTSDFWTLLFHCPWRRDLSPRLDQIQPSSPQEKKKSMSLNVSICKMGSPICTCSYHIIYHPSWDT